MNWNWPNLLTWLRILAIPLVLVLFIEGKHLPAWRLGSCSWLAVRGSGNYR